MKAPTPVHIRAVLVPAGQVSATKSAISHAHAVGFDLVPIVTILI